MPDHGASTLCRLFLDSCRTYKKPGRMTFKRDGVWETISTDEVETTVRRLSLGFQALGLKPGDRLAILSENRPEWVMADFAALGAGGVTVPIYTSLLPDQVRYIIGDAGAKIVVCSDLEMWGKIASSGTRFPSSSASSSSRAIPRPERTPCRTSRRWAAASEAEEPDRFERTAAAVRPEDLASIIYTSGTTGPPKGVMLSHANFTSNVVSLAEFIDFAKPTPVCPSCPCPRPRADGHVPALLCRGRPWPTPKASRPSPRTSSKSGRPSSSASPGSSKRSMPG